LTSVSRLPSLKITSEILTLFYQLAWPKKVGGLEKEEKK